MAEHKVSLTSKDDPVPMGSWGAEAVHDYSTVYARKSSNLKDDQATLWTSMYEKNLGRKVSELPPWIPTESGRKESAEQHFGDPEKKDFASVHRDRACDSGAYKPRRAYTDFQTAEQRRAQRRRKSGKSTSSEEGSSPAE